MGFSADVQASGLSRQEAKLQAAVRDVRSLQLARGRAERAMEAASADLERIKGELAAAQLRLNARVAESQGEKDP